MTGIYNKSLRTVLIMLLFLGVSNAHAQGWRDLLKSITGDKEETAADVVGSLRNDEIIAGLKEALGKGTQTAVNYLGKEDGFLANTDVRIPMPSALNSVERGLRMVGQDQYADQFIETMNRAAEQAVPVAANVFSDTIQDMSITDAKNILSGPDDAATQYFRENSSEALKARFLPIVKAATDRVGLTSSYKTLVDKVGPAASFMDTSSLDLDNYVTDKALDGLFLMVAREEKKIREDPLERTTDLLKKVFAQQ